MDFPTCNGIWAATQRGQLTDDYVASSTASTQILHWGEETSCHFPQPKYQWIIRDPSPNLSVSEFGPRSLEREIFKNAQENQGPTLVRHAATRRWSLVAKNLYNLKRIKNFEPTKTNQSWSYLSFKSNNSMLRVMPSKVILILRFAYLTFDVRYNSLTKLRNSRNKIYYCKKNYTLRLT